MTGINPYESRIDELERMLEITIEYPLWLWFCKTFVPIKYRAKVMSCETGANICTCHDLFYRW
jgi:hypothetical protein